MNSLNQKGNVGLRNAYVKTPAFAELFSPEGIVPVGNTPDEFARVMVSDIVKWAKVIIATRIRAE